MRSGWGIVARNCNGQLVAAWASLGFSSGSVSCDEVMVIRDALLKAKKEKWRKIEVQGDCKEVVDRINKNTNDDSQLAVILEDIRRLIDCFCKVSFVFIRREGNYVDHVLAQFAIKLCSSIVWKGNFSNWLQQVAITDLR
ncbi:hypothetical protein ACH5RR_005885 [Cinchona calisaya]|uniref:RNase H type-1 domain-containing protein n=1 Tax=Cinchona calisaya TaxID=153742 RepID=A0ABD3AMH9_9GENT